MKQSTRNRIRTVLRETLTIAIVVTVASLIFAAVAHFRKLPECPPGTFRGGIDTVCREQ